MFVFFAAQAIFYAVYIGFGIPPDETYHFGSIQYYAHQPFFNGPFTQNQDSSTLPIIRAIDHNPDFLYHYLLSLPLRAMEGLGWSTHAQIIALRLISTILALLSLYIFKKILDEISDEKLVKNLAVCALTLTGMSVWVAGAVNYDNLANLLFLLFVYFSIKSIKKPQVLAVLFVLCLALLIVVTKHVFAPVLILGLVFLAVHFWRRGYRPKAFSRQLKVSWGTNRIVTTAIILLTFVSCGLFLGRIGDNVLRYHSVQPDCSRFFTVNECRTYNVYNRNFKQKRSYSQQDKTYLLTNFDPFSYTGQWFYTYYNTLYFQLGDRRFESEFIYRVFAALLVAALAATAFLSRARLRLSKAGYYVLLLCSGYVFLLFAYNLSTYVGYGRQYAFQGRYLLPVLGFIYFFVILLIANTYRARPVKYRKLFGVVWLTIAAMFFAAHFPPYLLAKKTNSSWRQEFILPKEVVD